MGEVKETRASPGKVFNIPVWQRIKPTIIMRHRR